MNLGSRLVCALAIASAAALTSTACTSSNGGAPMPSSTPTYPIRSAAASPGSGQEQPSADEVSAACPITSADAVRHHFRAARVQESVGTTGIGDQTCHFALGSSNAGVGGVVTVTMSRRGSAREMRRIERSMHGARAMRGVGRRAVFAAHPPMLWFLHGALIVSVRADLRVPAGPAPRPMVVRADLVGLSRAIAADL